MVRSTTTPTGTGWKELSQIGSATRELSPSVTSGMSYLFPPKPYGWLRKERSIIT